MKGHLGNLLLFICNHIVNKVPSYTFRHWFYRNLMKYEIADNVAIHMGVKFLSRRHFKIGNNSVINQNCFIDNRADVEIGENVILGHFVKILTADHDLNSDFCEGRTKKIKISDYVFIGNSAMVLGGTTIARGGVLGAFSLLTKDIGEKQFFYGIPAKFKYQRNSGLKYSVEYKRSFF